MHNNKFNFCDISESNKNLFKVTDFSECSWSERVKEEAIYIYILFMDFL